MLINIFWKHILEREKKKKQTPSSIQIQKSMRKRIQI